MGTERCWAAQLARFAPESGSGVPGLSACTSFYLQQPPEFHVQVIKLALIKGETRSQVKAVLWGWGEVLQSGWEHIGRAWKEKACNLRSFLEVHVISITARWVWPLKQAVHHHICLVGEGKTQHVNSVMCFFFCLASKRSNKQWRACRAAWSWVSVPRVAVAGSRLQPFAALAVQVLSVPLH